MTLSSSSPASVIVTSVDTTTTSLPMTPMSKTMMGDDNNNNKVDEEAAMDTQPKQLFPTTTNDDDGSAIVANSTPRDLILQIGVIVGKLCQVSLTDLPKIPVGGVTSTNSQGSDKLVSVLVEMFVTLSQLADTLDLKITDSIHTKLTLNRQKYPKELCKGKAGKYTQYSHVTGITKTNQVDASSSSASPGKNNNNNNNDNDNDDKGNLNSLSLLTNDFIDIATEVNEFAMEREWSKFHTPRNLVMALLGEFGELSELLQWDGDNNDGGDKNTNDDTSLSKVKSQSEKLIKLSQEIADVTIYAIRVTTVCNVVKQVQESLSSLTAEKK